MYNNLLGKSHIAHTRDVFREHGLVYEQMNSRDRCYRARVEKNQNLAPIEIPDGFWVYYSDEAWVWEKSFQQKETSWYDDNGLVRAICPIDPIRDVPIKQGTHLFVPKGAMLLRFVKHFDGKMLEEISSEEYRVRELSKIAAKQSLLNILKKKTTKKTWINANDVLIEGKKVFGTDMFIFNNMVHEDGNILYDIEDEDLFLKEVGDDENHKVSTSARSIYQTKTNSMESFTSMNMGITTIKKEIPNYSREEFTNDFIEEMNYFMFMISQ